MILWFYTENTHTPLLDLDHAAHLWLVVEAGEADLHVSLASDEAGRFLGPHQDGVLVQQVGVVRLCSRSNTNTISEKNSKQVGQVGAQGPDLLRT